MKDDRTLGFMEAIAQTGLLTEIWEHFPENMFLMRVEGPDFVVEAANPKMTEVVAQDCIGKRLHDFLPWSVAEATVGHYRDCLRQDKPLRYEEHAAFRDGHGEERAGHWLTLLVPVHDTNGAVSHVFGIAQDVTELRLACADLERYNQDLEAVVEVRTQALNEANRKLQEANTQLELLASRDSLTGVGNRRYFQAGAEREMKRARRHGSALSLLMFDLDGFKQINDQDGHAAGDAVLQRVAASVQAELRTNDLFARYGGDEFVLLLPDTPLASARQMGDRLRNRVQAEAGVAISLGAAGYLAADNHLDTLVQRADAEVLSAKRGRKLG